jgi:ubiquinone/menaquinone biosynthesis C-methylase UbiE/uncharacterized protein YbaR (Trm112 family)
LVNNVMTAELDRYRCPQCKGVLRPVPQGLCCPHCTISYPIAAGIPDFIGGDGSREQAAVSSLQRVNNYYDFQARTYELTRYPMRLILHGGRDALSFRQLMGKVSELVEVEQGLILDAACGPVTLGRRLASPSREVYGTDLSQRMLRQGAAYVKREKRRGVYLSRARVEALPFEDALFDAAVCGAALKLFLDPVLALCEIGRTMKVGAPLVATTLVATSRGIFRFRFFRERARRQQSRIFELDDLQDYLTSAGFADFQFQTFGSMLLFQARKRRRI